MLCNTNPSVPHHHILHHHIRSHLSRQLVRPFDDSRELLDLDILRNHRALRLVLLIQRHLDRQAIKAPSTHLRHELLERLALQAQPRLQHVARDLTHGLCDRHRDADADQLLEAGDVGDQVRVQVVGVEGAPELGVGGAGEEVAENVEFLDGFGEGRVAGGGESRGRRNGLQDVRRKEVQAEREVGGGEDGEGFDEDVGDGFVAGEVGVELVAGTVCQYEVGLAKLARVGGSGAHRKWQQWKVSDRANNYTSLDGRDSVSMSSRSATKGLYIIWLPLLPRNTKKAEQTHSLRRARLA